LFREDLSPAGRAWVWVSGDVGIMHGVDAPPRAAAQECTVPYVSQLHYRGTAGIFNDQRRRTTRSRLSNWTSDS
jgi:hypothetical protein